MYLDDKDDNTRYRQRQIKELVKFVNKSDADFILLGGDFNVDPKASIYLSSTFDKFYLMKNQDIVMARTKKCNSMQI